MRRDGQKAGARWNWTDVSTCEADAERGSEADVGRSELDAGGSESDAGGSESDASRSKSDSARAKLLSIRPREVETEAADY